ncbi:MAG: hypothetical protein V1907_00630 [Candidatus Kerfeldbacteria bacterium]
MTMQKKRQWYVIPLVVLAVGVVIAGYVLWRMVTKEPSTSLNDNRNSEATNLASCGNGVCENVACLSTNCPKPETPDNCPEDCLSRMNDNSSVPDVNSDQQNANSGNPAGLQYSLSAQTKEQKNVCPPSDANLSPERAVAIAGRNGVTQGTKDLSVSFYHYGLPIDQCVWEIKSFLTATSGKAVVVIDSTQEVYDSRSWKE